MKKVLLCIALLMMFITGCDQSTSTKSSNDVKNGSTNKQLKGDSDLLEELSNSIKEIFE